MKTWLVTYRNGEIEGWVEADSREEAIEKFMEGDASDIEVNYEVLYPEFCEAEIIGEAEP